MEFTAGPPQPKAPWFKKVWVQASSTKQAPDIDIAVEQDVLIASQFMVNSGVLTSGRRPERPGN